MDAMTHAIEGYVSREWTPHGDAYALQALRMIRDNLERAVAHPEDDDARGNMLIAANLAIQPTSAAAIGIAHSLSHPCGAHFDVPHGVANAINLPWVIEFNAAGGEDIADKLPRHQRAVRPRGRRRRRDGRPHAGRARARRRRPAWSCPRG